MDNLTSRINDAEDYRMFHGLNNFLRKAGFPKSSMVTKTAICRVLSTLEPIAVTEGNKRRAEGGSSPDIENLRGVGAI